MKNIEFYALEAPEKIIDYQFLEDYEEIFLIFGFILPQLVALLVRNEKK